MDIVHILHEPTMSSNGAAFLFPLRFHARRLRAYGISPRFFDVATPEALTCDVLCVSSRFFRSWWGDHTGERVIAWLQDARRTASRIVWFDISDSTGTTQFPVLPYVDRYAKAQVLRDRSCYGRQHYGSRIFADDAHRTFGVSDQDPGPPHLNATPSASGLAKVCVSWNSGLAYYGYASVRLGSLWHRFPSFPRWYPQRWDAPSKRRPIAVSCRIGTNHHRATIAEPRRRIRTILAARGIATGKVSRWQYFQELRQSLLAVSPFGLGEITLRDFEITICGATMVKQDMEHLETWPNLWVAGVTYLPFRWDLADFDATIDAALCDPKRVVAFAQEAQQRYRMLLTAPAGHAAFCERFVGIITAARSDSNVANTCPAVSSFDSLAASDASSMVSGCRRGVLPLSSSSRDGRNAMRVRSC